MPIIKELREKEGLSISKTSQKAGVNAASLCQIERGRLAASVAVRAKLAEFYGKPENELFNSIGLAI